MIEAIVLDIDGVLNDGKFYNSEGKTLYKKFCDVDFTAIKKFKAAGLKVFFLSGDIWNVSVAMRRDVSIYNGRINGYLEKDKTLKKILGDNNINSDNVVYCGDDDFDLPAMKLVKYPTAPKNCSVKVRNYINHNGTMLNRNGGEGVVDEIFEQLVDAGLIKIEDEDKFYEKLKQIDKEESELK